MNIKALSRKRKIISLKKKIRIIYQKEVLLFSQRFIGNYTFAYRWENSMENLLFCCCANEWKIFVTNLKLNVQT